MCAAKHDALKNKIYDRVQRQQISDEAELIIKQRWDRIEQLKDNIVDAERRAESMARLNKALEVLKKQER